MKKSLLLLSLYGASLIAAPRIGIVGGGLAGLTAAYRLMQAGLPSIVYEGSNRFGGRCFSGKFPNGQVYEHGGELIDTDHVEIQQLIAELGLTLDDLIAGETPGTESYYEVIDYTLNPPAPVKYTYTQANADYQVVAQQMNNDANNSFPLNDDPINLNWPLIYPPLAYTLDSMTMDDYINQLCAPLGPGGDGSKSKFAQLLKVAYVIEFGADTLIQSPLNLLFLLGFNPVPFFRTFGISDERYHTHGGNSLIVKRLLEELTQNKISLNKGYKLIKIRRSANGQYIVTFNVNGKIVEPDPFDEIVLAIPFIVMNKDVDFSQAEFSDLKKYAISHLNMSENAKLNTQFLTRFWRDEGNNGETFATSDPSRTGIEKLWQNTWEVSRAQPGKTGILVDYTGGSRAQEVITSYVCDKCPNPINNFNCKPINVKNSFLKNQTCTFLNQLNFLLPGATNKNNFSFISNKCSILNVVADNWSQSPWQLGAYSYWTVGQYIGGTGQIINGVVVPAGAVVPFAGFEGVAEPYDAEPNPMKRNCHFAGEQTSYDSQGYLNGAVASGDRVAIEIGEQLGIPMSARIKILTRKERAQLRRSMKNESLSEIR